MRASRTSRVAYAAIALLIALVVIVGVAKTRQSAGGKSDVQSSGTTDASSTADATTAEASGESKPAQKASPAEAAISAAAKKNRYVFVTFYRKDDAASDNMQAALKPVQAKLSDRASFVRVDADDPAQQAVVSRYGADRSPMPLTLVVAPNGAVTAGFPTELKKTDFSDVFVSNGLANTLKVLQSGKLAAVCVQGPGTKNNKKSIATAEELKAAPELGGAVEVVKVDPSDRSESKFMKTCQVDTHSADAQLLVLAPPGKLVGKFDGTATKDTIMASLRASLGGGGCGSGGCAPSGCGP